MFFPDRYRDHPKGGYHKIPKISPRAYFFSKAFYDGLIFGGAYLRTEIDWASLLVFIVGSKFTVFALFHFSFEGNFPSTSPLGAYIWRGDLTEGFLRSRLGGLYLEGIIRGGAYFRNFTVLYI